MIQRQVDGELRHPLPSRVFDDGERVAICGWWVVPLELADLGFTILAGCRYLRRRLRVRRRIEARGKDLDCRRQEVLLFPPFQIIADKIRGQIGWLKW